MSAEIFELPTLPALRVQTAESDPDAALIYAVEQFLEWYARYLAIPLRELSSDQQHRFERIIHAWEDRILTMDAHTVPGVRAKLRYMLSCSIENNKAYAWVRSGNIPADDHDDFTNLQNGLWELIEATGRISGMAAPPHQPAA